MKPNTLPKEVTGAPAFTLTELLVVLAVLTLLAVTLLPAMAGTSVQSHQAQCLNNLRQLTTAWHMFADENNGRLAGNLGGGASRDVANLKRTWALGWLSLYSAYDNFRLEYLRDAQLGPYARDISIYKCPADRSTFNGNPRVRSVSMNGYLGDPSAGAKTSGFRTYARLTQITQPSPSQTFVFIDERDETINDGFFFVDMWGYSQPATTYIGDFPAAWHNGSCSLSFADGHVEAHEWLDPRTKPPFPATGGMTYGRSSPHNSDMDWLRAHASAPE